MVHLVTQDTAVTRQAPAAKSLPFTLHLPPVEDLRNLVATHPAAVGLSGVIPSGTRSLPVFLVSKQASLSGKQPVLAERYSRVQFACSRSSTYNVMTAVPA